MRAVSSINSYMEEGAASNPGEGDEVDVPTSMEKRSEETTPLPDDFIALIQDLGYGCQAQLPGSRRGLWTCTGLLQRLVCCWQELAQVRKKLLGIAALLPALGT